MSAPAQEPAQSMTTTQINAWIHRASLKRRQLLLTGADPAQSIRAQAFLEMATLCLDALEEVRIISAQLREDSQAARTQSQEIVEESAQLLAQFTSKTESQLLDIFKGVQGQRENPDRS